MNLPRGVPGLLSRIRRETITKLISQSLMDRDFADDVMQATSFSDYVSYLRQKRDKSIYEKLFFIAPKEEQMYIWQTIRGEAPNE
jgi:hypothetical protein